MENYILPENATLENFAAIETDMVSDFVREALAISAGPIVVIQRAGAAGEIVEISGESFDSLCCTVNFDDCTKKYQLKTVLSSNFITFENIAIKALLDSYLEARKQLYIKRADSLVQTKHAEKEAAKKAAAAARKQASEKEREAKYLANVEKAKEAFASMEISEKARPGTDLAEFFHFVGWLAENISTCYATIPDFLVPVFNKRFGDAPRNVVNTKHLTTGGHVKHWGCEIKCWIKNVKNATPPPYINLTTTDWTQGIHNTHFLWYLIENYGFQIGKHQDIDRIIDCIPEQYMSDFEAGRAA
jgi:hypothetical protein